MSTNETQQEEAVLSRDAEERLLAAGRKVFGSAYPDPERSGGFDSAALKEAARRSLREPLPAELLDALTWSSETFADYERYLREARFERKMRYVGVAAAAVLALGAALWWSLGAPGLAPDGPPIIVEDESAPRPAPAPEVMPDSPRQEPAPQPAFEVASLDLRGRSPVRGGTVPEADDLPVVPASRVELTVILPIGSEEGEYEVSVLPSPEEAPIVMTQAQAGLANQNVTLEVSLDLSNVEPDRYYWGLRRGEFPWAFYGIEVR